MCYDGLNLKLTSEGRTLINSEYLSFNGKYNRSNGEVHSYPLESKDNGFFTKLNKFSIYSSGSIHKLAQNGFNINDFNYKELEPSIFEFAKMYNTDPYKTSIHNIEFGVNITPPFEADMYNICKRFIGNKNKVFHVMHSKSKQKIGVQIENDNYTIKIYSKTLQEKLNYALLRVEVKYKRMQQLFSSKENTKEYYMIDLLDREFFYRIKANYLKEIKSCLILEDFETDLKPKQQLFLANAANPNTWTSFDRRERYNNLNKYNELVQTKATTKFKECIMQRIIEKVDAFENSFPKKIDILPTSIYEQNVQFPVILLHKPSENKSQKKPNAFFITTKNYQNGITKK